MKPTVAELAADVVRWASERMLVRLRDELVALGVNAELRDNNSALMVSRPHPGLPEPVVIDHHGAHYCWQDASRRHPTRDPQGAALALAKYVKRRRDGSAR
ncbi:hypothetical protein GCM10022224_077470 [Nonomuraea antimicrobica]|uniref:Uncharacterized protein n=1 Tax=Nonomuraea antimicrobica TaxID=561173 RepID=A0ABP7D360_9ACTN